MKYALLLLWLVLIGACSATKSENGPKIKDKYEVVTIPYIIDNDTTNVNELRFQQIKSAKDAIKLMYENYGRWSKRANGKYQENLKQHIWKNVKILGGEKNFLVIADGVETNEMYFASLMVFDDQLNDCLHESHPLRNQLLTYFTNKMDNLSADSSNYKLFP